jgi:hypothetical protein
MADRYPPRWASSVLAAVVTVAAGFAATAGDLPETVAPPPPGQPPLSLSDEIYRAVIEDSTKIVHLRTYWLNRDNPGDVRNQAWAGGGWVEYHTDWIADTLKFGIAGYTSQPIYAPEDEGGTLLLAPVQEGYWALGQAYGAIKVRDQVLTVFRQMVNQPEVNPQDNRMTPNTFEGVTLGGEVAPVEYFAGFLTKMKPRDAADFTDFATKAGAIEGGDEPMVLGGLTATLPAGVKARASAYLVPNILASAYTDAIWTTPLAEGLDLRLSSQLMAQTSVGDDALTGSSFDTWVGGIKAEAVFDALTLSLAFTQTGDGANWNAPYGSWPGYSSMIVKDFNRAGEWAVVAGAAYDFASLGAPGLSVTGAIAYGDGAEDPDTGIAIAGDLAEYDLTLDYSFESYEDQAWLQPLRLRGRAAYVDQGDAGDITDFRIIANYEWKWGGPKD